MLSLLKPLRLDFRIKIGYGAAFILLLVSYILTFYANKNLIEQSKGIVHTNKIDHSSHRIGVIYQRW